MSFPFRAPARPFTPEPADTPYRRAQQEWDARMGSAVLSARTWRTMAFAALGLSAALALALTAVALQRRTFVHVVEVAPEGQVLSVRAADATWSPTETQTAYFLGRFVRLTRSLPTDAVVLRENWLEAYRFLTPQAATQLNEIARADDPFASVGTLGRVVHVRSIVQRSPNSWQVAWEERTTGAGAMPPRAAYTGLFTVRHAPPRTADDIAINPLGLFITEFSWSRDR
jgi:type IV secretion system protein VirB5